MDVIPRGSVTREEYCSKLDELAGQLISQLPVTDPQHLDHGHEALARAQGAAVLGGVFSMNASQHEGDRDFLERAVRHAQTAMAWYRQRNYPQVAYDFAALALFRFLRLVGEAVDEALARSVTDFVCGCADRCEYTGAYINHNLNTALVCEYAYLLTGEKSFHKRSRAKTLSSLRYFDENDGCNPEIAQTYGIYGLTLLAEIAEACREHDPDFATQIVPYVRRSAETLATYYLYQETGELMAINSRETVKMVSFAATTWSLEGFEILASFLDDGRYRSMARIIYDYWLDHVCTSNGIATFPRWKRVDSMAPFHLHRETNKANRVNIDRASMPLPLCAYALLRLLGTYRKIPPEQVVIASQVTGKQSFFRRRIGKSVAVVSNVLYSPLVYMTRYGACLVGEELHGEVRGSGAGASDDGYVPLYMHNSNDYETTATHHEIDGDFAGASVYSRHTDCYSSAFFSGDCVVWVTTLSPAIRKPRYELFMYYRTGELLGYREGAWSECTAGQGELGGLDCVLVKNGDDAQRYLCLASLGQDTSLMVHAGGASIEYHMDEDGIRRPYSVLLVREWEGPPDNFLKWVQRWRVLGDEGAYQLNSPSDVIYLIEHRFDKPRVRVIS